MKAVRRKTTASIMPFVRWQAPHTPPVVVTPVKSAKSVKSVDAMDVYTDGSCVGNGRKNAYGGIGVFFGDADPRNVSECVRYSRGRTVTNQVTELMAALRGASVALGSSSSNTDADVQRKKQVNVLTDSEYVVKAMNSWASTWTRNGWRNRFGKQVANADLMRQLYALKTRFGVRFVHVPAHRNAPSSASSPASFARWRGNAEADRLATSGAATCILPRAN